MLSSGKATFTELCQLLSTEDMLNVLEIVAIDAHNARLVQKALEQQ